MKALEKALKKVEGYLISMKRNTMEGRYELEVGIPKNWAYKSTEKIECEVIQETKQGDMVKIFGLDETVVVDDLIEFVNIIIDTNKKIAKMQEELDKHLEKQAQQLEEYAKNFMDKIEQMKESSFIEMEEKQKEVGIKSKARKKVEKKEDDEELQREIEEKLST
jgi:hypothetical protein